MSSLESFTPRSGLLWVHGWGMSPRVWHDAEDELPQFAHSFFSYRPYPNIEETKEGLVRNLYLLREQSGVERWVTVGWSLGAVMALELLLAEQLPAAGLICIGGTLKFSSRDRRSGWPERVIRRMQKQLLFEPGETLRQFAVSMLSPGERTSWQDAAAEFVEETDFTRDNLMDGLDYLIQTDLSEEWRNMQNGMRQPAPIRWIHGQEDPICPWEGTLERLQTMPEDAGLHGGLYEQTKYRIVPGAGHAPFLTQKKRFYDEVRSLLNGY